MSQQQVRVKLQNNERGYYASLHQKLDPYDSDKIEQHQALIFFRQSGLNNQIIDMILEIATNKSDYINREQFYVALRLISYAQNHQEISLNAILRNQQSVLPKFETNKVSQQEYEYMFALNAEQEEKYQSYIKELDPYKSYYIQTAMAMQIFERSNLDRFKIQTIINLVDPSITAKIKMNIYQYTVIAHLIALYKQGIELPQWLPNPLTKYLEQAIDLDLVSPSPYNQSVQKFTTFEEVEKKEEVKIRQEIKKEEETNKEEIIKEELPKCSWEEIIVEQKRFKQKYEDKQQEIDQMQQKLLRNNNQLEEIQKVIKKENEDQETFNENEVELIKIYLNQQEQLINVIENRNKYYRGEMMKIKKESKEGYESLSNSAQILNQILGIKLPIKNKNGNLKIKEIGEYGKELLEQFSQQLMNIQKDQQKQQQKIESELRQNEQSIKQLQEIVESMNQKNQSINQLNQDHQIDQIDQVNQANQIDQVNQVDQVEQIDQVDDNVQIEVDFNTEFSEEWDGFENTFGFGDNIK